MTAQQTTALKQLAASMPQLDRAVAYANDATQSGTKTSTPQPATAKWSAWDQARITQLRSLATAAGLQRSDLNDAATLNTKLTTWFGGLNSTQKANLVANILQFLLYTLADQWADAQAADTIAQPAAVSYGPSWSAQNGFATGITEDMIREALKQ